MARFRKKPVVVEAVQWDGNMATLVGLGTFSGSITVEEDPLGDDLTIHTLEGSMTAQVGDWIIKGVKNELYPCRADIFDATYEPVPDDG